MRSRKKPSARIGRRPSTTKEGISTIGIELFSTVGFNEVSVDRIADAAGIARRTFFRYFPSKNAVPWETSTASTRCASTWTHCPPTSRW